MKTSELTPMRDFFVDLWLLLRGCDGIVTAGLLLASIVMLVAMIIMCVAAIYIA